MTRVRPAGPAIAPGSRRRVLASVVGAGTSGVLGLLLVVVVTRGFGVVDAGRVLTGVAVLTVATAACLLGVDTGLVWLLPRQDDDAGRGLAIRSALRRTGVMAVVAVGVLLLAVRPLAGLVFPGPGGTAVAVVTACAVPVLVASSVLVAAVRGLERFPVYLLLQFGVLPAGRVLGPVIVVVGGGLAAAALAGWAMAAASCALLAAGVVRRTVRRGGLLATPREQYAVVRRLWGFCRPRAVSAVVDASAGWIGVVLVAALAGSAEAARFGAVSRCALAGLLVLQAVRVATATDFSRLLAADAGPGSSDAAGALHRAASRWVVTLSWPVFGLLAAYPDTVLGVFGPEYRAAAPALVVVAAAMAVNTGCGNAQTVLLMSGDSRRHLVATVAGLGVTVGGAVVLVPEYGAVAAAGAWAAGIVVENALVVGWLVTRLRIAVVDRRTLLAFGALLTTVVVTIGTVRSAAGAGLGSLLLATVTVLAAQVLVLGLSGTTRARMREAA